MLSGLLQQGLSARVLASGGGLSGLTELKAGAIGDEQDYLRAELM